MGIEISKPRTALASTTTDVVAPEAPAAGVDEVAPDAGQDVAPIDKPAEKPHEYGARKARQAVLQRKVNRARDLLFFHCDDKDETELLKLLRGANRFELNAILEAVDLNAPFTPESVFGFGVKRRDDVAAILGRERIADISIKNRARLVTALQRGVIERQEDTFKRGAMFREALTRDVFLNTHGPDLTLLKIEVDRSGDHFDLPHLIYTSIENPEIRRAVLTHIAEEAASSPKTPTRLISDIDDTFVCKLHDERYPQGTAYPGVKAFYEQFSGPVTFLTARPSTPDGIIEDALTWPDIKKAGVREGVVVGVDDD